MPESVVSLLPLVGIALLFWLLIIRPASRRQKQLAQMQDSLQIGDEVVLTSGILGSVAALEEGRARIEVAPGVVITVARGAVGQVVPPEAGDPALGTAQQDEEA
ncbi:preprotein translocase subunit YajC [Nocardioides ferulae]|uniref:preprotein translocase subunit YajC n=1 Tax=Nocardioides ferulae TaxID=2340821 RepID=UPI000EACA783|nr:preprotein translocase subunit YajC [Nocardioides ferulae]